MSSVEDLIRSFGMSGMLITDEIKLVEEKFGIEFGHLPVTTDGRVKSRV